MDRVTAENPDVVGVILDSWWPNGTDPLYLAARGAVRGRVRHLGITRHPSLIVDGRPVKGMPTYEALEPLLAERRRLRLPVRTEAEMIAEGPRAHVKLTLGTDGPSAAQTVKIRCVLVESQLGEGAEAPRFVFRDSICPLGDAGLTLDKAESRTINIPLALGSGWNLERLGAIVVVEDAVSGETLGATFACRGDREAWRNPGSPYYIPAAFSLDLGRPNPFRDLIAFRFGLPRDTAVLLDVYDVQGRRVSQLLNQHLPGGLHTVSWKGENEDGRRVCPGIYFLRMEAGDFRTSRKVVVAR
jgi:hypothetical protein